MGSASCALHKEIETKTSHKTGKGTGDYPGYDSSGSHCQRKCEHAAPEDSIGQVADTTQDGRTTLFEYHNITTPRPKEGTVLSRRMLSIVADNMFRRLYGAVFAHHVVGRRS